MLALVKAFRFVFLRDPEPRRVLDDHEDDADDLFEDLDDVAEIEDDDDNGVSGKVRRLAAEHKASAQAIKENLRAIQDRDGWAKSILGSDTGALNALNQQVMAMNTRATVLESAAAQVVDPEIKQILFDRASALKSEVIKLQAYISAEDSQTGILGGLLRLFR